MARCIDQQNCPTALSEKSNIYADYLLTSIVWDHPFTVDFCHQCHEMLPLRPDRTKCLDATEVGLQKAIGNLLFQLSKASNAQAVRSMRHFIYTFRKAHELLPRYLYQTFFFVLTFDQRQRPSPLKFLSRAGSEHFLPE